MSDRLMDALQRQLRELLATLRTASDAELAEVASRDTIATMFAKVEIDRRAARPESAR